MKRQMPAIRNWNMHWKVIPTAIALTMAIATAANSETIQTPLSAPATLSGTSGGGQASQCGFVGSTPSHVLVVSQTAPLRFKLQSQGQPTLWIKGPVDRCVMADSFSNGAIEIPGVWEPGSYSIYVGDLQQGSHPYTLSVVQEN